MTDRASEDGRPAGGPAAGTPRPEGGGPARPARGGAEDQDPSKTPGDGTLQGSTPAGLTVEELRRRAEEGPERGVGGTG